jgi:hypothetical protein
MQMVHSHCRLIFCLGKKVYSRKERTKMSTIANFGWEMFVKCGKYSLAKFANFVYFCIACRNCYHTWAENGSNFRTQYKSIYKTCKVCMAIFSAFYNISQPNYFAIVLILVCSFWL